MDGIFVCGLLLLFLPSESVPQEFITKPAMEASCRGKPCLLGENTVEDLPALDSPWGTGISVAAFNCNMCDYKSHNYIDCLLKDVLEAAGPFNCIDIPNYFEQLLTLRSGLIDVVATQAMAIRTQDSFLYPHAQNDICVVLKKREPQRQAITQAFTEFTWAAILFILVCFAVVLRLIGNQAVVLETFRTFISGAFTENEKRPISNGLSLLLSAFGVIMITAFSSKFMSFLAAIGESVQPQTLEELNARVSFVYGNSVLKTLKRDMCDSDNVLCRNGGLLDKIQTETTSFKQISGIATSTDIGLTLSRDEFERYRRIPEWVDKETGGSLTHIVPQCLLTPAYAAYPVHEGWQHADRLSHLLQKAIEAGLHHKLKGDETLWFARHDFFVPDVVPSARPQPLTLSIMLEPAVVLVAGTALAAVAFVGELIVNIMYKKTKNKL